MSRWTHSICERCWLVREGLRPPLRLNLAESETCCFCGKPTQEGIYVREDPNKAQHCAHREAP
jgi:hypothetical protein